VRTEPEKCPTCGRRKRRSSQANRRYWALVGKLTTIVYQWHEFFKDLYIEPEVIKLPDGRRKVCDPHSSELDVPDFNDYMTKVEAWAAERGVQLDDLPQSTPA
jgi:hypothetical protein